MLVSLAHLDPESDEVSPLRLQKLLYYVQGWSLALRGRATFEGRFQAWRFGPVVPEVYFDLASFGKAGVEPKQLRDASPGYTTAVLSDDDRNFIASVWDVYRKYSAVSLVEMTHNERPWIEARANTPASDQCNEFLSEVTMAAYFKSLAE